MWSSYAIGLGGIALLAVVWVAVQRAWSRTFAYALSDPDPLAGRPGCHSCDCTEICERRLREGSGAVEEDTA